jgi:hypothetical protein
MDKDIAIRFLLGMRPSGGPYSAVVEDDCRFLTNREYRLTVTLTEQTEIVDANGEIDWEEETARFAVSRDDIANALEEWRR